MGADGRELMGEKIKIGFNWSVDSTVEAVERSLPIQG